MSDGEEDKGNQGQMLGWVFFSPLPAVSEYLARTKAEVGGKDWWCLALTFCLPGSSCAPRAKKQASGTASRKTVGLECCGETS